METQHSGPNPLCEIGRNHPRDRHRMKPLEGHPGIWVCPRHDIFATIVPQEEVDKLERGDAYPLPDGGAGVVVRHGDERGGGIILYYRAED